MSIEDQQGRSAVSNTLPFRIYSGEETLADQMKKENFKDYGNGLYAWDIMEPWAISKFGSNVNGEEESVRVPAYLEAWFGSHESGTYGYLGYDIPWKQVVAGNIPQTLYIPSGCNLTLTNMEVLSSVHIIVENGGKLTLSDSVVQGIIDVQSGGTFSMNYDSFNNEFTAGASLCGQLRLADGAALENAAIYSHANYLANGDLTDRTTSEPVVVANGNVTVKGTVAILGDDGGSDIGQTAFRVNGTLTLADKDTTLVAYGGSGKTLLYTDGGTAIDITEGSQITGDGKLVAIGGDVLWEMVEMLYPEKEQLQRKKYVQKEGSFCYSRRNPSFFNIQCQGFKELPTMIPTDCSQAYSHNPIISPSRHHKFPLQPPAYKQVL